MWGLLCFVWASSGCGEWGLLFVAAHRLRGVWACSTGARSLPLTAHELRRSWQVEPISPELAGRFLSTAPLGKSSAVFWIEKLFTFFWSYFQLWFEKYPKSAMTSLLWWSLASKREPGKEWREDELLETLIRGLLNLLELPASSPSPLPPPLFLHLTSSPSLLSLPSLLLLFGFAAEATPAAEWGKTSVCSLTQQAPVKDLLHTRTEYIL